jgi:arylsulfatase A
MIRLLVISSLAFILSFKADCAVIFPPPNVVLIFIDDMGYADVSPFGNTKVRTPHLEELAKQGRKFTTYYATPVCSMSRASLLTGSYNVRVSVPGVFQPNSRTGLNPKEDTIADVLKRQGYATACFGKWHLGDHREFLPLRQGFDEYLGIPYSNNMIKGYMKNTAPPLPLYRGDEVIETEPDQTQFTRRFTEEAIQFIKAKKDQPFFVYLPHPMIHDPLAASVGFKGKSADGPLGDAIEEIDWSVGQIVAALKELNLDRKTLVIFTSDNGPSHRDAPPFRGNKTTCFEGGVREPCIMSWPGKIPAGTTCDQILGNIDMLPTLAKLAGVKLDPSRFLDGKDVSSLLFDASPIAVRDTHLYFGAGAVAPPVAIRQGDWKLFLNSRGGVKSSADAEKGDGNRKKTNARAARGELYNLAADPSESKNLAAANPEIVERLNREARTRYSEIMANKRPLGFVEN